MRGLKAGKPDIQQQVYKLYAGKMMAICTRYGRDREEAIEMLQEGFIRVFRKIDLYDESGSLEGWIRRVITNASLRVLERNARMYVAVGLEEIEHEYCADVIESDLAAEDLLAMIRRLPEGYRIVFNLYAIEGYSHEEIAEELGITVGTSKSQLSRARQALQKMLENESRQLRSGNSNA